MTPLPTVFILNNIWVHVSTINGSDMASNVEASIDKTFCFGTTLNVSDVELNDGHIQFRRYLNNFRPRCKNNIVKDVVFLYYSFDHIN